MELSGYPYAPATLPSGLTTYWIEDLVDPRAGLHVLEQWKSLALARIWIPGPPPSPSPVKIPTVICCVFCLTINTLQGKKFANSMAEGGVL